MGWETSRPASHSYIAEKVGARTGPLWLAGVVEDLPGAGSSVLLEVDLGGVFDAGLPALSG